MEYKIDKDSKPDYDEWGWDDYWGCAEWVEYHKKLKMAYGADMAKQMWYAAWEKQDGFSSPYNWCKYNSFFYEYFKKELGETWFIMEIGGAVNSVAEGAGTTAKVLKTAIPIVAVLLIAGAAYWGYKTYLKE